MIKILHTADWHLGVSPKHVPRSEEHARFLKWLVDTCEEHAVNVLLVSGDIFDRQQPANADIRLLHDFLRDCKEVDALRHIVITSGNHDPDALMGALSPVYDDFSDPKIHTIVGSRRQLSPEAWAERCVRSIEDGLTVCALPYLTLTSMGARSGRHTVQDRLEAIYKAMAERALSEYPSNVPIAMGHLSAHADEAFEKTHSMRGIFLGASMPADRFDERFKYIALGHYHQHQDLRGDGRVRFCGTPVPTCLEEARSVRKVILLEVDPEAGDLSKDPVTLDVPAWRESLEFSGTRAEIEAWLSSIEVEDGMEEPYLYIEATEFFTQRGVVDWMKEKQIPGKIARLRFPTEGGEDDVVEDEALDSNLDAMGVLELLWKNSKDTKKKGDSGVEVQVELDDATRALAEEIFSNVEKE